MNPDWNTIRGFTVSTAKSVLKFEFPNNFYKVKRSETEIAFNVYLWMPLTEEEKTEVLETISYFQQNFNGGKQYNFNFVPRKKS